MPSRKAGASAQLSGEELSALRIFAKEHGRTWKSALRLAWETGNYRSTEADDGALQRLRNRLDSNWLTKFTL